MRGKTEFRNFPGSNFCSEWLDRKTIRTDVSEVSEHRDGKAEEHMKKIKQITNKKTMLHLIVDAAVDTKIDINNLKFLIGKLTSDY